jgi:4'-phosphopantetheinyl transferase
MRFPARRWLECRLLFSRVKPSGRSAFRRLSALKNQCSGAGLACPHRSAAGPARTALLPEGFVLTSSPELLSPSEVHVWAVPCDDPPMPRAALLELMSQAERERVSRLHFEADRRRAVIGRGVMRSLVGAYLGVEPARLRFDVTATGKPQLARAHSRPLAFNVSHSGRWVMIAVSCGMEVGVDVECIRPLSDMEILAERFLAPDEAQEVLALPAERRERAFFACWTRKEAYVKALGAGLGHPLDAFRVSTDPDGPALLLHVEGGERASESWTLWSAAPEENYLAALAVAAPHVRVRSWYLTGSAGARAWSEPPAYAVPLS